MTHKLIIYRREVKRKEGYGTECMVNYTPVMEALSATGLDPYFVRRHSKYYASYEAPIGCLHGDTKEIFTFRYKFSEEKDFFAKLAAFKDVAAIAKYYLIQG